LHRDGFAGREVASVRLLLAEKLEILQIACIYALLREVAPQLGRWLPECPQGFLPATAQFLWQRPVNELHWIENTVLKN
jgi:hypothetical protein